MSVSSISGSGSFDPTQVASNFFKKADTNGDGSIDKSELKTALSSGSNGQTVTNADVDKIFKAADTDGDGKISESENAAQMKRTGGGKSGAGAPPSGGVPPSGGAQGSASSTGASSSDSNTVYDKKDLNKDGTVSFQEEAKYDLKHPNEIKVSGYDSQGNMNAASTGASSQISLEA
jgi:hypothetical protein